MPRKKKADKSWGKAEWKGFANVDLSENDKKAIKDKSMLSGDQLLAFMQTAAEDGYSVSVQWSDRDGCFMGSLMGKFECAINAGYMLTARHTDLNTCMSILRFKHEEIAGSGPWITENGTAAQYDW